MKCSRRVTASRFPSGERPQHPHVPRPALDRRDLASHGDSSLRGTKSTIDTLGEL